MVVGLTGAIIGLTSSIFTGVIPKIFENYYREKKEIRDNQQEIEMFKLQIEANKDMQKYHLQEVIQQSEATQMTALYENSFKPTNIKWIDAYCASVRPSVTYFLAIVYGISILRTLILNKELRDMDYEVIMIVITFWFGYRTIEHISNKFKEK